MIKKIAVLLTCYNRKDKTLACLTSFYKCNIPNGYVFDIYMVDDSSTDGTAIAVKESFPHVKIIHGTGNLFWAGGMRIVWRETINKGYDGYLLINDDVVLFENVLQSLIETHDYALTHYGIGGIYVSSTIDKSSNIISYGGTIIRKSFFGIKYNAVLPSEVPLNCQITNANILFVNSNVVEKIGLFDPKFKQSFADYDYSYTAYENNLPVLVCPGTGGYCKNDHVNNWSSVNSTIQKRIKHLYSPKGLEYKEYMYYIRKHFPLSLPYLFIMVWLKTLFPGIWDKYKK
jgi:GT2 family glycosyltransferase